MECVDRKAEAGLPCFIGPFLAAMVPDEEITVKFLFQSIQIQPLSTFRC